LPDTTVQHGDSLPREGALQESENVTHIFIHRNCAQPRFAIVIEQVQRCAAFKAAICLADPHDRGPRTQLNLGHTFAHALESAAGFALPHGRAVALGLLAALRLSGLADQVRMVEDVLSPEPVSVDKEVAWAAIARDKKAERGAPRLVLLDAPGKPRWGVELPDADVRRALDQLIA